MLKNTIKRIENEITGNIAISEDKRSEIIGLLNELQVEIDQLSGSHSDEATSIAKMTETTVLVASRKTRDQELFEHSLEGMKLSARNFELSHPKLTGLINSLGQTLSGIGI